MKFVDLSLRDVGRVTKSVVASPVAKIQDVRAAHSQKVVAKHIKRTNPELYAQLTAMKPN